MEIGAIVGIRPVQPVRAERSAGDLAGVFRIEFQREQEQDSYVPHGEGSERGIEDDEDRAEGGDEITESEVLRAGEAAVHGGENQIRLIA